MSRGLRDLRCPGCGEVVRKTHHCRRSGWTEPPQPMPADFRDRIKAAAATGDDEASPLPLDAEDESR